MGGGGGLDRLLKVTVLEIAGVRVKLGFEVDKDIPVHRHEIWERMQAKGEIGGPISTPDAT
jgi:carbon storage regulator CsrA